MTFFPFSEKTWLRLTALVLGLSVILISCSPESKPPFPWIDRSGTVLPFSPKIAIPDISPAAFSAKHPKNSFILKEAFTPSDSSSLVCSFEVHEDQVEIAVSLFDSRNVPLHEAKLLANTGLYALYLPLEAGKPVKTISLSVSSPHNDEAPVFTVESFAFSSFFSGYRKDSNGRIFISSDFHYAKTEKGAEWSLSFPAQKSLVSSSVLHLEYTTHAQGTLFADRLKNGRFLKAGLAKGVSSHLIPLDFFNTTQSRVRLVSSDPEAISACYIQKADNLQDIPVDAGLVLQASGQLEDNDFAAYRWNAQPSVIIFDFVSYALQDAYLKRIAFFVEKKGFAGRLANDAEIANLHGWNAHDYKSEDLARFFAEAERLNFSLNPQEINLKEFLLKKGIITRNGGKIVPGGVSDSGAIVSISRESADYLRYTFLNHELTHAIFFADSEYREFSLKLWNSMDSREQWFWYLYFGWMNYNISSSYLMANEMQAYLMQQPVFKAEDYFTKTLPSRLYEKYPELEKEVSAYMEKYGSQFAVKAAALESFLQKKYGFNAGKLLAFSSVDSF